MSCDKQHKHANTIHPDVVQYGFFTCQGKGAKGQSPNVDGFSSGFQLYINEVVLGTVFGILMGPYCANIFDPRAWGTHTNAITLEVMRVVLAVGLFAIGVELPPSYLAEHAKGLLVIVVPTMAFGWLIIAGTFGHSLSYVCL